jgi:cytochrome c oxidase subunit 2
VNRRALLASWIGAAAAASGIVALAQQPLTVAIRARKFAFSPTEVTLKRGVPVVLEFTTADVVMGFNAPQLNLRADIVPGQLARIAFTPERSGTFEYLCDIFCGEGHEKMTGTIRVI